MKNWKIILNVLLLSTTVIYFSSCDGGEEDTPNSPSITVTDTNPDATDNEIEVMSGEDVAFSFTVNAPGGFNVARLRFDGTMVIERNRNDLGLDAGTENVDLTFTLEELTSTGTVTIEAVDDLGQSSSVDYTITVTEPPLASFQAILLQTPTASETSKTFFSTTTGEIYSVNDVNTGAEGTSATIDFGYYYGPNSRHATLASPSDYPEEVYNLSNEGWNQLNATTLRRTSLSVSQFNETTTLAQVQSAFDAGTDETTIMTNLEVGDVLAFRTDADKTGGAKMGLIYVSAIEAGTESNKSITLEILVEE